MFGYFVKVVISLYFGNNKLQACLEMLSSTVGVTAAGGIHWSQEVDEYSEVMSGSRSSSTVGGMECEHIL